MNMKKLLTMCVSAAAISAVFVFPSFASGWQQNDNGYWYEREDSSYPANAWEQIGGVWYLFDQNGYMLTGWQQVGSDWFYLENSGAMVSNTTRTIDGKSYTFGGNGAMVENTSQITAGRFEGRTFINDWSNIKLTIPDNFMIASPEDISYISDCYLNGTIIDMIDMAAVISENCGVIVMYTEPLILGMNGKDAFEAYNQLSSVSTGEMPDDIQTVQIGGDQYLKIYIPDNGYGTSANLYVKGIGDHTVVIAFIYDSSTQAVITPVISMLTTAH